MKYLSVIKYLGALSIAASVVYVPALLWAFWFREYQMAMVFFKTIVIVMAIGALVWLVSRGSDNRLIHRETLALVGFSWLLMAGYGALPFVLSGELDLIDAYFESMSGFTTTGSSILTDIESLPRSLLFWRSFTHWLGGLGIVVILVTVLPFLGAGGKLLYRSEVPGIDKRGLRPRIKDSALILVKIYCGLTLIQTLLLLAAGMNLYDALCHTFGTLATGGYSTRNDSIAAFDNVIIEVIIIVFMVLGATSFGLQYMFIKGKWREVLKNSEWRLFLCLLTFSILLITLNLMGMQGTIEAYPSAVGTYEKAGLLQSLRMAAFQTTSIMTNTGYATADFDTWPQFSRALLVVLMLVGGCSGSTSGGIKVVRLLILGKMVYWRIKRTFQPKTVRVLRVNDIILDKDTQNTLMIFCALYIFALIPSSLLLSMMGLPSETAFTAAAATLNNVGPGLGLVGATENFALIPPAGKMLLSLLMVLGRLEFLAILVLFIPAFWKRD